MSEDDSERFSGWLPPDPGGIEPDLEGGPAIAPPGPPSGQAPPTSQAAQPGPARTPQQQLGWNQPASAQPSWAAAPGAASPDNGAAIAGFTLSIVGGGLLLLSVGLSSIVSAACAGFGIFYSRRGRARVDRGETRRHRDLAQAGLIIGVVALVLAALATAFWVLVLVLYATSEEFRREIDDSEQFQVTARTGLAVAAGVARLAL